MKGNNFFIALIFLVVTLTYSAGSATNKKEEKSINVLKSIINNITRKRNNDNVIENVESQKPVFRNGCYIEDGI